jgi:cytochrome b6-f complex iron-sulfur subunit/menaquinol-cytochrome c reductase iron-sulfur subunit
MDDGKRQSDSEPPPTEPPSLRLSEPPATERPEAPPPATEPPGPPRRGALRLFVAGGSVAFVGALVGPAAPFLSVAASAVGRERWVRVVKLEALPEGKPTRLALVGDERDAFTVTRDQVLGSAWLERRGAEVRALSAACPHLGCSIDLAADARSFACPCHASRFAFDGKPEAGPSPRAMDALATRVADGWVEVDFRRYRQGIPDKVEA